MYFMFYLHIYVSSMYTDIHTHFITKNDFLEEGWLVLVPLPLGADNFVEVLGTNEVHWEYISRCTQPCSRRASGGRCQRAVCTAWAEPRRR